MKKLIFLPLLILSLTLSGQFTKSGGTFLKSGNVFMSGPAAPKAFYEDDFEAYSTGTLTGQGNWLTVYGAMVVVDNAGNNEIRSGTVEEDVGLYYNQPISANQYAEVEVTTTGVNNGFVGVCVRASFGNMYLLCGSDLGISFGKLVSNVGTNFEYTGETTITTGDKLRLEAEGTTIRAYKNATLLWTETDSDLSSGYAGLSGNDGQPDNVYMCDNWEAGDL